MRSSRQRRNSKIYNLAWNKMGGLTFDYSNCRRKGHVALSEERLRSVFGAASFVLSSTADQQEFNLVEADICGATRDVCFGPKADITLPSRNKRDRGLRSYCWGAGVLVPRMKFCISSRVTKPSLLVSIALKMRS